MYMVTSFTIFRELEATLNKPFCYSGIEKKFIDGKSSYLFYLDEHREKRKLEKEASRGGIERVLK